MKKEISVTLTTFEADDFNEVPLEDIIKTLQEALNGYQDYSCLVFDSEFVDSSCGEYGIGYLGLVGYREETDEEYATRLERERVREELKDERHKNVEKQEYATYLKLKEKFGND